VLYNKNQTDELDEKLFENPTEEYRGKPFWAWNCELDKDRLKRQIEYLKVMGFGGFHMHSRTGMAVEYLSESFMDIIKECVNKAENENMTAWLYDEDRWPSGSAGGMVTKNPKYRHRYMLFTITPLDEELIACFDIVLDSDGGLLEYRKIDENEAVRGKKWYVYMMTLENTYWYKQAYVDTLNPEAMQEFIKTTYDAYKSAVGEKFGKSIPAIFTDEPQFRWIWDWSLRFPDDNKDVIMPWTPNLPETFADVYGFDLVPYLPELVWEKPGEQVSRFRYLFYDHITERFVRSFIAQCGKWCNDNGIALTGHLMEEKTLRNQSSFVGDAMRSYPHFHIPGIDMLCNSVELTTAKQVQSSVHQCGREAMVSELYGVTGWDFDFRGHKFQGDWQAALGVTIRVPHLSWVSMRGGAKRDYPAPINHQSPWYSEYSYVENHFARINTAMTRGKPLVRVGVIHPIESYWLHIGPESVTSDIRDRMEENFQNLADWLIKGCVDFDYICEATLPELCKEGSAPLRVGEMAYDTIILSGNETLRKSTVERLKAFCRNGGKLIIMGRCPKYIDAEISEELLDLCNQACCIEINKVALLKELKDIRYVEIHNDSGVLTNNLLYQLRQDKNCRWLFIAHAVESENNDIAADKPQKIQIKLNGKWKPVLYDTIQGVCVDMPYYLKDGDTIIETTIYDHDSLLMRLTETKNGEYVAENIEKEKLFETSIKGKVRYSLTEPNVLLLDVAEYSLDGEAFVGEEEIIRIDKLCRNRLDLPDINAIQPWTVSDRKATHYVTLRFKIDSDISVNNAMLAVEDVEEIKLNNKQVPLEFCGYYVDEDIKTVVLPEICKGRNVIEVKVPFGKCNSLEWCYLLGEFNVTVEGSDKRIVAGSDKIGFDDVSRQGLAFYGGNIIYETDVVTPQGDMEIQVNHYRGAMIRVMVDGKDCGVIAYAPYKLRVKDISKGNHTVTLKLYGNRANTFGALHDAEPTGWIGPTAWSTKGSYWTYSYRLHEMGILSEPIITVYKN